VPRVYLLSKCPDWLWGPPSHLCNGTNGFFTGVKGLGYEVYQSPPSERRLRMSGVMPLPHCILYVIMAQTGAQDD